MSKKSSKPKQALAATTAAVGLVLALIFMPHVAEAQQSSTPPGTTAPTNAPPSPNQPSPVKNTGVSAPTAFIGVASATGNGFVYYHGGQINKDKTEYSKEFIALDVTRSWDTSSPAWINLTIPTSSPGFAASGHSATMSKDLSTLFLTAPVNDTSAPFLYQYNVKTGTWSSSHAPAA
ncbi:hypothetical protein BX616_004548, partial [Lobosporangium transversale]